MEQKIIKSLSALAEEKNIKILLACETGSRAWGFPSPDSDYDVRFIYAHPRDWYLSLKEKPDAIDLMQEDRLIDLSGWELRKTLKLLAKSNVSVLERMQSEILYARNESFIAELKQIAQSCFSPIATMHHYLSMGKGFMDKIMDKKEVKLKDYFYAMRSLTAGFWIREKETIPPLLFKEMFDLLPQPLTQKIEGLIALKASKNEDYLHPADAEINTYLMEVVEANEKAAKGLPSSKPDWEMMDNFFVKWIK